jgi:hypothetical protein
MRLSRQELILRQPLEVFPGLPAKIHLPQADNRKRPWKDGVRRRVYRNHQKNNPAPGEAGLALWVRFFIAAGGRPTKVKVC